MQQGYQWAYIFSAIRPATGEDFTLVLPVVSAAVMDLFLAQFAAALPADAHAVLVLDGAGWHDARALTVPGNLTLVPLPAYSPELNPIERVWKLTRRKCIHNEYFSNLQNLIETVELQFQFWSEPNFTLRQLCAIT